MKDDTRTTPPGWIDERRGASHERGYGWAWAKLRNLIMLRDHGMCQPCKRRGEVSLARDVDHITPKANGGTDDAANLQAICARCHEAKTLSERVGAKWDGKPRSHTGLDGWPK